MVKRTAVGMGMGMALSFVTRAATAKPDNERFGAAGQLAVDQSFSMMATRSSYSDPALEGLSYASLHLAPQVSWFFLPQVSLRLGVSIDRGSSTADAAMDLGGYTALGGTTGFGYALPLGDHFSLWPSAGGDMTHSWTDAGDLSFADTRLFKLSFGASVPVLWHPAPHFFVGLGPGAVAVYSGRELGSLRHLFTGLRLTSTIGGYLSL
jgi:hypothetical protein